MKEKGIIVENKLSDPKKAELVIDILNKLINEGLSFNQITQVLRTAESEGCGLGAEHENRLEKRQ